MWMYFSESLMGDPETGTFLEVRATDVSGTFELVHTNLGPGHAGDPHLLLSGERDALLDALDDLADVVLADTGFMQFMEVLANGIDEEEGDPDAFDDDLPEDLADDEDEDPDGDFELEMESGLPVSAEEGWVALADGRLLNLLNSATIALSQPDDLTPDAPAGVLYRTAFGHQPLYAGDEDEAVAYIAMLTVFLDVSPVLINMEEDLDEQDLDEDLDGPGHAFRGEA